MQKVFMRKNNDCMTACLATLFGLDYEQVPRFFNDNDEVVGVFHDRVNEFLKDYGLAYLSITCSTDFLSTYQGYLLVSGESYTPHYKNKGVNHCVIYKDGKLWHDPKPNPIGIIEPSSIDLFYITNPILYIDSTKKLRLLSRVQTLLDSWSRRSPTHIDIVERDKLVMELR